MSIRFKDIFVSLLSIEGIKKKGRGLDSCLTSEAKTKLHCLPLQSLGKEKQGLLSLSVRHSPSLSHLIAKRSPPCQPIKAVKKAWRKQAWQPFHAPPAYVHVVFLHCFWSSHDVWPFLPSCPVYRSNLLCQPVLWVRSLFKVLLNITRQQASYINCDGFATIPCDVLRGSWSLAFLFSPILDSQPCWHKELRINRERVMVQTSVHFLAPACSFE